MRFIRKKRNDQGCVVQQGHSLCESIHSLGNITATTDILDLLKRSISDLDEQYIVFVNFDGNKKQQAEAQCRYLYKFVTSKELMNYTPQDSTGAWIESLKISAIIFTGKLSDSDIYDQLDRFSFVDGLCEIGNYTYGKDNRLTADLNLYCCKLTDDGIIPAIESDMSITEAIYHEFMHAYKFYNLHKNTGKSEEESPEYEKLLWYVDNNIFANLDIVHGIHALAHTLYALSDDEMPAYIGMTYEHFKGLNLKTSGDIANEISSSVCGTVLENSHKALNFLNLCSDPAILHKRCTILSDHMSYMSVWDVLEDLLECGFTRTCTGDIFQKISKSYAMISKRAELFKRRLYDVAFDASEK